MCAAAAYCSVTFHVTAAQPPVHAVSAFSSPAEAVLPDAATAAAMKTERLAGVKTPPGDTPTSSCTSSALSVDLLTAQPRSLHTTSASAAAQYCAATARARPSPPMHLAAQTQRPAGAQAARSTAACAHTKLEPRTHVLSAEWNEVLRYHCGLVRHHSPIRVYIHLAPLRRKWGQGSDAAAAARGITPQGSDHLRHASAAAPLHRLPLPAKHCAYSCPRFPAPPQETATWHMCQAHACKHM
jgi:hypothetical protein